MVLIKSLILNVLLINQSISSCHKLKFQQFLAPLQVASILPPNVLNTIFSNVEAIQAVNRELLSHMETLGLGDAFLALAPFIKLYSTYANNFAKAQATLQVNEKT